MANAVLSDQATSAPVPPLTCASSMCMCSRYQLLYLAVGNHFAVVAHILFLLCLSASLHLGHRSRFGAAGGANPPVCRLLNHSQVSFETRVKERKLEKRKHENRRTSLIKEVKLPATSGQQDYIADPSEDVYLSPCRGLVCLAADGQFCEVLPWYEGAPIFYMGQCCMSRQMVR